MPSYLIALIAFLLALGGLWCGEKLSSRLPTHHLVSDSRDSAKVGIGMLATLLALVLGLMITSAKRSFDEREAELVRVSSSVVLLDHALQGFGADAQPARVRLRQIVEDIVQLTRESAKQDVDRLDRATQNLRSVTQLQRAILTLKPADASQTWYQTRAMQLSTDIAQDRVLTAERDDSTVPRALLFVVCGWVVLIYFGLGVFMASNRSVKVTLGTCALAFACSIFIILELDTPYSGIVGVSTKSLLQAKAELGR